MRAASAAVAVQPTKGKIVAEPSKGKIAAEPFKGKIAGESSKAEIVAEVSPKEPEEIILSFGQLTELSEWLDQITFSRKKRNPRNLGPYFSDGVMVAEIFAHFNPRSVDLHNYPSANNSNKKKTNWQQLRKNPFAKLGIKIPEAKIPELIIGRSGVIEPILWDLKNKLKDQEIKKRPSISQKSKSIQSENGEDRQRPKSPFLQPKALSTSPPEPDVSDQARQRIPFLKKFGQHKDSKWGGEPIECSYDCSPGCTNVNVCTFELPPFTFSTGYGVGYDSSSDYSCSEDY